MISSVCQLPCTEFSCLLFARLEKAAAHSSVALAVVVHVSAANVVFETVSVFIVVAVVDVLVIVITLALGIAVSVAGVFRAVSIMGPISLFVRSFDS